MKTSDILRAAKARLTPQTWGQGPRVTIGDRECAAIAINFTPCACWMDRAGAFELLAQVTTGTDGEHDELPRWNDRRGRTLQEVHEAFDAAIAIAESQETVAEPQADLELIARTGRKS